MFMSGRSDNLHSTLFLSRPSPLGGYPLLCAHTLAIVIDNCPFWINGMEIMTVEMILWLIFTQNVWRFELVHHPFRLPTYQWICGQARNRLREGAQHTIYNLYCCWKYRKSVIKGTTFLSYIPNSRMEPNVNAWYHMGDSLLKITYQLTGRL